MIERSDPTPAAGAPIGTAVRIAAAVAILIGGLVHLQLYFDGYRDFPDANLGRSFMANAVASVILAVLLVLRRDVLIRLAGAGLVIGTLIAFWLSRTDTGVFGFSERGLQPSPQAALTLAAEIVALVLIAATFVPAVGAGDHVRAASVAVPAIVIALVLSIGGGALWARSPEQTSDAGTSTPAPSTSTAPATTEASPTTVPATTVPATTAAPPTTRSRPRGTPASDPPRTTAAPTTTAAPPTTQPATSAPAASGNVTITIVDFNFDPETLEIPVGTTVEWINEDSFDHTVEANDGSFVSDDMGSGDRFTFQFTQPGTFDYICGIHPSMTGTIVVTG